MGFKHKTLVALLLILTAGRMSAHAQTDGHNTAAITIFVYNDARVPHAELDAAEQQASFIFRASGVTVDWLNCVDAHEIKEDCHRLLDPNEFMVHIVPTGRTSSDAVFGVAFLAEDGNGKYSDVFFDRIQDAHRIVGASAATLLAAVTAHELGHLLLGPHAHSPLGIMSPRWGPEDLSRISIGSLRFTPEQSARMRLRIQTWQTHTPALHFAKAHGID
ncbi:MAG: hypothetical protein DMG77_16730 [Acidobacteria bacterium]|nr:MAG: hypothetical protein DMG77_16730 [Acidobacteriota bacterium]